MDRCASLVKYTREGYKIEAPHSASVYGEKFLAHRHVGYHADAAEEHR